MSTGINQIHRIVIAIAIQVQAIDGFGVQVGGIVGRDESAPFGGVIPGIAIVQAGVGIKVISAVMDWVSLSYILSHPATAVKKNRSTDKVDLFGSVLG